MDKPTPKWPESLPPPVYIGKEQRVCHMSPDEFGEDKALLDLLHDMYWFIDGLYYVYTKHEETLGVVLSESFDNAGIEVIAIESFFYSHPKPAYKNDFVHLPPNAIQYDWHREAASTQMYTRFSLAVSAWKRKELDLAYSAEATVDAIAKGEPMVEAKPGFGGVTLNLRVVLQRARKWFMKKGITKA